MADNKSAAEWSKNPIGAKLPSLKPRTLAIPIMAYENCDDIDDDVDDAEAADEAAVVEDEVLL